jgi:hypothetical protein
MSSSNDTISTFLSQTTSSWTATTIGIFIIALLQIVQTVLGYVLARVNQNNAKKQDPQAITNSILGIVPKSAAIEMNGVTTTVPSITSVPNQSGVLPGVATSVASTLSPEQQVLSEIMLSISKLTSINPTSSSSASK